jgi:hypothetical protein
MFKLIYYEPGKPYGAIDSNNQVKLIAMESILISKQITIICVVDYANRLLLNKCKYFDIHRELIDDLIFDPSR